ncbi:DUF5666 domain-containing protein [Ruegeria halocynthiae]|uniref:DUF5666 domain-containing protein n=1 Tax=Ruegeria halocynthiae TaxID=985054 RepID=UPI00068D0CDB|nr:DUF5666 domain-containing protein [Ruegeria halocynthiae]
MIVFSRVLATTLIALWLAVPSHAQESEEREGGIIGTGIVGTITHLGSVYVNGLRIQTDDAMAVTGSAPAITADELQPGHTVAIVAALADDGWVARQIRQVLPVVGPVTAIARAELTVLGTKIDAGEHVAGVNVGDWVAISGLWQGRRVIASRIETLTGTDHQARLSGTYLGPDLNGNTVVGGSNVSGISPRHLQLGELVRVFGQPTPDGIEATRLETGLFDATVGLIQVQGYYSVPKPSGLYTVLGSGLVSYTDQPEMIEQSDRVIRCGQMGQLGGSTNNPEQAGIWAELGCH